MEGNNRYNKLDTMNSEESIHTIISYVFGITATIVMLYLGIRHFNDIDEYGRQWGWFALMHGGMGAVGMFGIRLTTKNTGFFPKFRKINIVSTLITMVTILLILMITQIISARFVLEVTATEQALYTVFSAVTEELFFRGFICYVLLYPIFRDQLYGIQSIGKKGMRNPTVIIAKIVTAIFSGIMFGLAHVNYYGTSMIYAVSISGVIMGLWFSFFRAPFFGQPDKGYDITGLILGHFLLNVITVGQWLIRLS